MKKTLTIAAMAVLGLAAFTGCSKSSSSPSNTMTATINGASYSGTCTAAINNGNLEIASGTGGTSLIYPSLVIGTSNYTGTGTYTQSSSNTLVFGIDSSSSLVLVSSTGTITITSASSTSISGTFSYTCTDSTKVTNGSFTAKVN
jgi:hypothetical protein